MIRFVTALVVALALMAGNQWAEANLLPDDRPWAKDDHSCDYYKGGNWTIRICRWASAALPPKVNMTKVINILYKDYAGGGKTPFYTTVVIEPPNSLLSPRHLGAYLPATGNIVVGYPYDNDLSEMMHTIAHELLHALWDAQGISFDEHHTRIYCEKGLRNVEKFLEAKVDPKQVPAPVNRTWVHLSNLIRHCAGIGTIN